jgi:hypothetical protein
MAKVWRFTYESTFPGNVVTVNDWYYQTDVPAAGSEPPAGDVVDALDDHWRTIYRAVIAEEATVNLARVREQLPSSSTGVPDGAELAVNQAGTLGTPSTELPVSLSAIVSKRTGVPLRSARGYLAIPSPLSQVALTDNRLWDHGQEYWLQLQAVRDALDDVVDTGTFLITHLNPVVYSRTRHNASLEPFTFRITGGIIRDAPRWRDSRQS